MDKLAALGHQRKAIETIHRPFILAIVLVTLFGALAPAQAETVNPTGISSISSVVLKGLQANNGQPRALLIVTLVPQAATANQGFPQHVTMSVEGKIVDLNLEPGTNGVYSSRIALDKALPTTNALIVEKPSIGTMHAKPLNAAAYPEESKVVLNNATAAQLKGQTPKMGPQPDWTVKFCGCAPGCRSIIFHTKCYACICEISW